MHRIIHMDTTNKRNCSIVKNRGANDYKALLIFSELNAILNLKLYC
jgi:hypothetical protein